MRMYRPYRSGRGPYGPFDDFCSPVALASNLIGVAFTMWQTAWDITTAQIVDTAGMSTRPRARRRPYGRTSYRDYTPPRGYARPTPFDIVDDTIDVFARAADDVMPLVRPRRIRVMRRH